MSSPESERQPTSHGSIRNKKLRVRLRRSQFQTLASFAARTGVAPCDLLRNGGLRRAAMDSPKSDPSIKIDVRVSREEKAILEDAAARAHCEASTFVREGTMSIIAGVISRNPELTNAQRRADAGQLERGFPPGPTPRNDGGVSFVR
jgi:hypothetical protein